MTFPHSQLGPALVGPDIVWIKLHSLCAVMDSLFELPQLQGDKHILCPMSCLLAVKLKIVQHRKYEVLETDIEIETLLPFIQQSDP